tara:strand:- start:19576 stop:19893 length:318 start_codon:yes stop_codon:yes gene_type:complete
MGDVKRIDAIEAFNLIKDKLYNPKNRTRDDWREILDNCEAVIAEIEDTQRMRFALEFYANETNWTGWRYADDNGVSIHVVPVDDDCGDIAKQALSDTPKKNKSIH